MHSLSAGPEKIAASCHALSPDMSINTSGLEITCELRAAVRDAGGGPALRAAAGRYALEASGGLLIFGRRS